MFVVIPTIVLITMNIGDAATCVDVCLVLMTIRGIDDASTVVDFCLVPKVC